MNNKKNKVNYEDEEDANLDYANFDNVDDRQYSKMMPTSKGKLDSLSYFKNSHKYAGRVSHHVEEEEKDEEEPDIDE